MFVTDIITEAARQFYMTPAELTGRRRTKEVIEARFALYKAMRCRGSSLKQIARWVGKRDHTAVMSGLKRADVMVANDEVYREIVEHLIQWKRA